MPNGIRVKRWIAKRSDFRRDVFTDAQNIFYRPSHFALMSSWVIPWKGVSGKRRVKKRTVRRESMGTTSGVMFFVVHNQFFFYPTKIRAVRRCRDGSSHSARPSGQCKRPRILRSNEPVNNGNASAPRPVVFEGDVRISLDGGVRADGVPPSRTPGSD